MRYGISGAGGATAVLRLMNERNTWAEEGLKEEHTNFQSDPVATAALVAGELDFTVGGAEAMVTAAMRGTDVRIIGLYQTRFEYQLIGSRDIHTAQDLKGRTVGVSRFGSNSHFATKQVLMRLGLDPDADVTIFQVGNTPDRVAALQSGAIQAALMSPDVVASLTQAGLPNLADMSKMDIAYPFQAIGTTQSLLERRPEVADAFLRAIYRGLRLFREDPAAAQRMLADRSTEDKPDVLQALWESYRNAFTTDLTPEPAVFTLLLEELGRTDPAVQGATPDQFLDLRPVRRVDDSGFPQQLFGAR
ncbi:MAG TPA: ABC transporter substrate-binding protein [Chloroflexota bacterium]|jgi:NitT/TauT family transport system substrate-binding protein